MLQVATECIVANSRLMSIADEYRHFGRKCIGDTASVC